MTAPTAIDLDWRRANPLPVHGAGTDKNSRGRVLLVGGAELVPGALRLTGEAVLRAGAGKLRMATVRAAATWLGVQLPEAGIIALPASEEGEIASVAADMLREDIERCDTLIIGPGMSGREDMAALVEGLLGAPRTGLSLLLDAAAITCAGGLADAIARHDGRVVMTPHHGEMARLMGTTEKAIAAAPEAAALDAAARFGAIIVLKAAETVITTPDGRLFHYGSDCVGLATGGSGDVLAGVIGGLMARGATPAVASAWGVWLHGEAGRNAAASIGRIGFLARDLLAVIPRLMTDD